MLEVTNLEYSIGKFNLGPLSIKLGKGEYLAIFGPSGSGKSLFLELIAGIRYPGNGSIKLQGEEIAGKPPRKRGVSLLFQDYALFPHLSVRENIAFPLKLKKISKEGAVNKINEICSYLSIGHLLDRKIEGLSGGEQQRVALARAIANEPKLLLLDEPLSALDPELREEALELLKLVKSSGITTIHVTHNREEIKDLATCILNFTQNIKP